MHDVPWLFTTFPALRFWTCAHHIRVCDLQGGANTTYFHTRRTKDTRFLIPFSFTPPSPLFSALTLDCKRKLNLGKSHQSQAEYGCWVSIKTTLRQTHIKMLTISFSSVCYLINYIRIVSALCSCKQVENQHAVTEQKTINRMHIHKKNRTRFVQASQIAYLCSTVSIRKLICYSSPTKFALTCNVAVFYYYL